MQNEPRFLYTGDGNLSLFWEGQQHSIGQTHPNFDAIIEALEGEAWDDLTPLLDVKQTIANELTGVRIDEDGNVFFNDRPIHNTLAERIVQFVQGGFPWKPLARFLANLMENPSSRAVNELYSFLEKEGIAITPDGCFLAYKGVRADFMDKYSGEFDNSVGQEHSIPRNEVDDDASRTCSHGFHVGSHAYATMWAAGSGNVMLVKVNPADAVAVPADHDASKLRVCKYEVVEIAPPAPLQEALVTSYGTAEFDEVESYDEDDYDDEEDVFGW
jgi:hypothetical protein